MERVLRKTYDIQAPASKVWEALTNPAIIKQYLFGTDARSDWRKGGKVIYKGIWDGQTYEDKGKIMELIPQKKMTVMHWNSLSGKPDLPENYTAHSYNLTPSGAKTKLTLAQEDEYKSDDTRSTAWRYWDAVVDSLKRVVEK